MSRNIEKDINWDNYFLFYFNLNILFNELKIYIKELSITIELSVKVGKSNNKSLGSPVS